MGMIMIGMAFERFFRAMITVKILVNYDVARFSVLRQLFDDCVEEINPRYFIRGNYRLDKLQKRLLKRFQGELEFWQFSRRNVVTFAGSPSTTRYNRASSGNKSSRLDVLI